MGSALSVSSALDAFCNIAIACAQAKGGGFSRLAAQPIGRVKISRIRSARLHTQVELELLAPPSIFPGNLCCRWLNAKFPSQLKL